MFTFALTMIFELIDLTFIFAEYEWIVTIRLLGYVSNIRPKLLSVSSKYNIIFQLN